MKKLTIFMVVCIITMTMFPLTASASVFDITDRHDFDSYFYGENSDAAKNLTSGNFNYSSYEGKYALIEDYTGREKNLVIPEKIDSLSVIGIGRSAFIRDTFLKSITLPDSLLYIADDAFLLCTKLEEVNFGKSLKIIGGGAFSYCTSLKKINTPDSLLSICNVAFEGCRSLSEAHLGNSVKELGSMAFSYCRSLEKINIPSSVTELYGGVFHACSSLKSISLPDSVTKIGDIVFSHCKNLETVRIPSSLTKIGTGAFTACRSLKELVVPETVKEISPDAFSCCKSELTLSVSKGSFAENFALENDMAIKYTDSSESVKSGKTFIDDMIGFVLFTVNEIYYAVGEKSGFIFEFLYSFVL